MVDCRGGNATTIDPATGAYLTRAIEDLREGDVVLTRANPDDPESPLIEQTVTRVFRRSIDTLRIVQYVDEAGNVETLKTTDEHPFYVAGLGWTTAGQLQPGQALVLADGRRAVVLGTGVEAHPEGLIVYNLEVEGAHTYFVSDGQGAESPVWVHNAYFGNIVKNHYGPAPAWMAGLKPHGHHIVFKGIYLFRPQMRKVLKESRAILARAGITDYVNDVRNLTWAPNRGHTLANATKIRDMLREAEKNDQVLETMAKIGENLRSGAMRL